MAYKIIGYKDVYDKDGFIVYDPTVNRFISEGKLTLKENEVDDLVLTVNQNSPLFGTVEPMQTMVDVYDDNELIFRGRALKPTRQMKDSGQFIQSFTFESIFSYLIDSNQTYAEIHDMTIKQFFTKLIDFHNSRMPPYKRFAVRNVNVTNSTDNAFYYLDYVSTWDTLKDKLLSRLGGYFRMEYKNGVNYLDYMQDIGRDHLNDTPIQFTKNMQSASVEVDPTQIITRLFPYGATIEDDDPNNTAASRPRIDIKSVNDGFDHIDDPQLLAQFGAIDGSQMWDDVHDPKILLTKAKEWLAQQGTAKQTYTVTALELRNSGYDSFKVSDRYLFINPNVSGTQLLRLTQKEIDITQPYKSALTFGPKVQTLSQYQAENKQMSVQVDNLRHQVNGYSTQIVSLNAKTKQLTDTISSQQDIIESVKNDVKNADFSGVNSKLAQLQGTTESIKNQVANLDYVSQSVFNSFKNQQLQVNSNVEERLQKLEGGSTS